MNNTKPKELLVTPAITRKEEVINVAARLFAAKGYHATTLDQIAEEIGVTKPALYYYVTSKEDILRTIINRIMEPMEEATKVGRSALPPREKMGKIIWLLVKFNAERKETSLIALEQANILPKRSYDAFRRRQEELQRIVEQTFNEGIEQGCFAKLDPKVACLAIMAVANSPYRWYSSKGRMTPRKIADQFIKLLENGYLKDGCRS